MRCLLLLLTVLPFGLAPDGALAQEPGLSSFTLPNGLLGVVVEDHRAPVVTQMVWYRVGSRDDPPGQAGTAHYLEHLMFQATDRLAPGEYSRVVAENGGTDNAFTSVDQTAYVVHIAADRLDLVMGMEAERMVNLAAAANAPLERGVVLEERRQVVDGDPGGIFRERLLAALYPGTPVSRPTIGSEAEIVALNWPEAERFYRAHYAPNAAILMVGGDVDPAEVRRLAERHFGAIPAAAQAAPAALPDPLPPPAERRFEMHDARVSEPQLTRLYRVPQRRSGDQRPAAAFVVLAELFGGERVTSLLAERLVQGDGIALGARAFYSETGLDPQSFGISLVPKPGVALADAEAALDALIAEFAAAGPDPADVARIKGRIRGEIVYQLDDLPGRVNTIGEALTSGLTLADVEAWPDVLQSVTADDLRAAAQALRLEDSVTGWMRPGAGAAAEARQ